MSTAVESFKGSLSSDPVRLQRRGRVLLGWLRPDDAKAALNGQRSGVPATTESELLAADARGAVASRSAGVNQDNIIEAPSPDLTIHIAGLKAIGPSAAFFNEGWTVGIADLTRVCAIQPTIMIDDSNNRTSAVDPLDIASVAAVTLPIGTPSVVGGAYNSAKQAWVFSSANPNLRVVSPAQGEMVGATIFGFGVSLSASFMQVALYNGRYLLRDGYHRAFGLLNRGITHAPVFVRAFETFEDLRLPTGLLPQDTYLGQRPPLLPDYMNDDVSAETSIFVTQKVVIIQALEVVTIG